MAFLLKQAVGRAVIVNRSTPAVVDNFFLVRLPRAASNRDSAIPIDRAPADLLRRRRLMFVPRRVYFPVIKSALLVIDVCDQKNATTISRSRPRRRSR